MAGLLGHERILGIAYNALIRYEREKQQLPSIFRAGELLFALLKVAGDQYKVSGILALNECIGINE